MLTFTIKVAPVYFTKQIAAFQLDRNLGKEMNNFSVLLTSLFIWNIISPEEGI